MWSILQRHYVTSNAVYKPIRLYGSMLFWLVLVLFDLLLPSPLNEMSYLFLGILLIHLVLVAREIKLYGWFGKPLVKVTTDLFISAPVNDHRHLPLADLSSIQVQSRLGLRHYEFSLTSGEAVYFDPTHAKKDEVLLLTFLREKLPEHIKVTVSEPPTLLDYLRVE